MSTGEQPQPQQNSNLIQKCFDIIEELLSVGNCQQSIEFIDLMLKKYPHNGQLYKKKAFAMISQNKTEQALKCINKAIKYSNKKQKAGYMIYKADLLYHMQKIKQSLQIYNKLLCIGPQRLQIFYRKGLCYLALNKYKQASKLFEHILSLNPQYHQCHIINAHSLFMQKNYHKTLKILVQYTENQDFKNCQVLYIKACCYYNLNKYQQCQKQLKNILEIDFGHVQSKVLIKIVKFKIQSQKQSEKKKKRRDIE